MPEHGSGWSLMSSPLRIATRKSRLALWQAEHVRAALQARCPRIAVELLPMSSQGDDIQHVSLARLGGKGLFIKALEDAMLRGEADLAVHSMKDVPAQLPPGFALSAVLQRGDPRDAFVSNRFGCFDDLPAGARLGTSSLRRAAIARWLRPDLQVHTLRGNVQTRLRRLDEERFDAILLAAAGLRRLGLQDRIREMLDTARFLPAIGQGALGIEVRADDERMHELTQALADVDAQDCLRAERALNARLGGSCATPLAGYAVLEGSHGLHLRALLGLPDGSRVIADAVRGTRREAETLGVRLAERMLANGAGEVLAQIGADYQQS